MTLKKSWRTLFRRVENKNKSIFVLIPLTMLFLASTPAKLEASAESEPVITSKIAINLDSHEVVTIENSKPQIIPGESLVDKEAREKAEAEAKAKAAAAAKAQAAKKTVKYNDPADFNGIYLAAGATYGIDPKVLKAIHIVETGASGSTSRKNPSGATGPMQFLPSTFRGHAVDGNGDGVKDICNVQDAIFSAAKYLVDCGYPNVKKALWGYNPSTSYYNKVTRIASSVTL